MQAAEMTRADLPTARPSPRRSRLTRPSFYFTLIHFPNMAPRNPTADTEPNFESEAWEAAIVAGGQSVQDAINLMKQAWKTQHEKDLEAWDEYLRQRQASLEQEGNDRRNSTEIPPNTTTPTEDETPEWMSRPTPSFLDILPARHILKKLEKKEFVELWHFTAQGCRDAASIDLATPDDTFGLINTEKGLLLQTVGASSTSSKVIKDENLSWELLTEGKTRMITCMRSYGWSAHEVKELIRFYVNLDIHPIRSQDYGLQTIMRYQEKVRRDWTAALKTGNSYAIGTINDDLMRECQRQVAMELQAKNNVSTGPRLWIVKMLTIFPRTNYLFYFILVLRCAFSSPYTFAPALHHLHLLRTIRTCSAPHAPAPHHTPESSRGSTSRYRRCKVNCLGNKKSYSSRVTRGHTPSIRTQNLEEPDLHGLGLQSGALTTVVDVHSHPKPERNLPFDHREQGRAAKTNSRHAQSAWEDTDTTLPRARQQKPGAEERHYVPERQMEGSSISRDQSSAQIGNDRIAATTCLASTSTNVLAVDRRSMAPILAPSPRPEIRTPLVAEEWRNALDSAGILNRYPHIPHFIICGANAGIPPIHSTFAPPNHQSITLNRTFFTEIVNIEFQKGRYWGPYSRAELESIIGPFQTSPLSLIPKAGKPGKFRLIQNLSYPRNLSGIRSINSSIESDLYPCTWGTFSTVTIIIQSLPPRSQGACRDVSEAYRIIPLAKDQWPGIVVRLEEDGPPDAKLFALNTCTSFGKKSSGGLFGMFGDALLDIF